VSLQCLTCGKHLESLKKSKFPHYENLPKFDEMREKMVKEAYSSWNAEKYKACENAKAVFDKEIQVKISTGELVINNNSKFSTYYNSSE
jgi:hypothetical protein